MTGKFIIGNWKMNPVTLKEAKLIFGKIKKELKTVKRTKVIICPPVVYLTELKKTQRGGLVTLGAQDTEALDQGAQTGGVSAYMIRDLGIKTVILGHSERRRAGDSDEIIKQKVKTALTAGLGVILCIGETIRDSQGEYLSVLQAQLTKALADLAVISSGRLMIAYEPVWAIGQQATGVETADGFFHNKIFIRKVLATQLGRKRALAIPVLYGGSVNTQNAEEFLRAGQADGLLVGRDSLNPQNFGLIVKMAEQA